jgi:CRISPR-associated exonuclease Cas4
MISLTPSQIIEYQFCPRFIYFEYVLGIPEYEEKLFKVQKGRELHERKLKENIDYLRKRIGVVEKYLSVYLTNEYLRGEVDEVLLLNDGTMAPLDYKFAEYKDKIFTTYKTQLTCYAILIEKNYEKKVNHGYLVYTRSKNKLVEIEITEKDKKNVYQSIEEILKIIEKNFYPKATKYKKKCVSCAYKNICTK